MVPLLEEGLCLSQGEVSLAFSSSPATLKISWKVTLDYTKQVYYRMLSGFTVA